MTDRTDSSRRPSLSTPTASHGIPADIARTGHQGVHTGSVPPGPSSASSPGPAVHRGPQTPADTGKQETPPPPSPAHIGPDTPGEPPAPTTTYPYVYVAFGSRPWEREVVDQMVALREAGIGYSAIAHRLNAESVPTNRGGLWHPCTVQSVLKRHRPDLCPPRKRKAAEVPQRLAPQHYRDRDRQRKHRDYAASESAA